jgi:DNA modification methylase
MEGELADTLWTDPPYGVEYVGKTADALTIENDGEEGLGKLLDGAFSSGMTATKPGAAWYVAAPARPLHLEFANRLRDLGVLRQSLAWVKDRFVLGRQDYNWQHETIFYGWKPGAGHRWYGLFDKSTLFEDAKPLEKMSKEQLLAILRAARDESTVIRCDRPSASLIHPTMKPVALISRMLFNSTEKGDVVLDLFGGSGSTMISCEQLGRRARLIEIDPVYCDVAVTRWQQFTGKKAERHGTTEAAG